MMRIITAVLAKIIEIYYVSMIDNKQLARLLNKLIKFIFDIFDWLVYFLTFFICRYKKKDELPRITSKYLNISAKKLAGKIKAKELKCVDVVEAYINRIKDVQPYINSVVQDRFDEALKEAKAVDELVEKSLLSDLSDKPLLGVPLTVKETIAVKGMSHNAARSRVTENIAKKDAEIIQNLREAGAIPLLVSNTPELCLHIETSNPKYGRTNNPYDLRRTAGGSSGGEVSLLGSAASVIGVGSDIGGSLRIPAFFCGVFGHKPTPGYVPNEGHIPTSTDSMWNYYFTLGPLTRYAEDLPLMLENMITEKSKVGKLRLDEKVDVSKLKIYYMYGEGPDSVLQRVPNVECIRAISLAISALRDKYQCKVEETKIKEFQDSVLLNSQILYISGVENVFQTQDDKPDDWGWIRIVEVILKKLLFRSSASMSCILYGLLKRILDLTPENVRTLLRQKTTKIHTIVTDLLGNDAVLLYPSFSEEAPLHHRLCSKILDVSYLSIFNVLGMPVTQCPVGMTREGIPIGIQIVSAPHNDRLSLAVARALEKELGGWTLPPNPPV
ncbi:fatty-acid amide hydrolase 2 isoform X2 [Halyomorpha halys]|uniref:fatty-acid amide hydrolase 2 isoform X2 n=1 Tax=Halyomorpha halys TaxID=286706 RepID=UPI0006D4FA94|nr:fatty-acid amide hydrolase 2-like isoform X2 [Halyomorpha halys]